jgi:hypothetical protein
MGNRRSRATPARSPSSSVSSGGDEPAPRQALHPPNWSRFVTRGDDGCTRRVRDDLDELMQHVESGAHLCVPTPAWRPWRVSDWRTTRVTSREGLEGVCEIAQEPRPELRRRESTKAACPTSGGASWGQLVPERDVCKALKSARASGVLPPAMIRQMAAQTAAAAAEAIAEDI